MLDLEQEMSRCRVCPRKCGADREHGKTGYCKAPSGVTAARAALQDGRERLGVNRVVAIVTPGNERSVRLLAKLGLSQCKRVRLGDSEEECLLLEVPEPAACQV